MKALREYFTRDRIDTWAVIVIAIIFAFYGEPTAAVLCFVIMELRDINEKLEDKE